MKVFISWSGATSKAIAEILRGWLPSVIQAIKPYFSPDDIAKGSRWNTEIAKELEECKVGLLCLTSDNLESPWIMFEAGALSKSLSASRVCPLLFGIAPSNIKGPLVQFQAAPFDKGEMKKAVCMMNEELTSAALTSDVLNDVFEMWWPKLEDSVKKVLLSIRPGVKQHARSERDILEEILARVRSGSERGILEEILTHVRQGSVLSPSVRNIQNKLKYLYQEILNNSDISNSKSSHHDNLLYQQHLRESIAALKNLVTDAEIMPQQGLFELEDLQVKNKDQFFRNSTKGIPKQAPPTRKSKKLK